MKSCSAATSWTPMYPPPEITKVSSSLCRPRSFSRLAFSKTSMIWFLIMPGIMKCLEGEYVGTFVPQPGHVPDAAQGQHQIVVVESRLGGAHSSGSTRSTCSMRV